MNRLVIAEKPSVGKAIAAVLGAHGREDGCFIGNGYIVSWCFGHLAELAAADTCDEKYGKWRCEDLPILPQPWRYHKRAQRCLDVVVVVLFAVPPSLVFQHWGRLSFAQNHRRSGICRWVR